MHAPAAFGTIHTWVQSVGIVSAGALGRSQTNRPPPHAGPDSATCVIGAAVRTTNPMPGPGQLQTGSQDPTSAGMAARATIARGFIG